SGAEDIVKSVTVCEMSKNIASSLLQGENTAIYLGNLAQHHPQYSDMHQLVNFIADVLGAKFGVLGEAANSVGAYLAGAVPSRNNSTKDNDQSLAGYDAAQMLAADSNQPVMLCQGYILMNVEPEHDVHNAQQALKSLGEADFVVALSSFKGQATDYADVLLPIAPFTETSGTYVNTEGRVQTFNGVVSPLGDTRPAWKVIRVLGNLLALEGFDYDTSEQVRADVIPDGSDLTALLNNKRALSSVSISSKSNGTLERIGEVPIYQADPIVRRAESLQKTNDAAPPCAWMSPDLLQKLSINPGDEIKIKQQAGEIRLLAASDEKLPVDCVRLVSAHAKTSELGSMFGEIIIEKL
ncbi:MAG: molybdopterin-dependent oxidoreductase, partial [Nitrosomonas sp.]|nr:molybdopterin-dependent oxidoreductase [Nitrosomonas sp.]